jgi:hypothetical protein
MREIQTGGASVWEGWSVAPVQKVVLLVHLSSGLGFIGERDG